jgi:hypothetical protein
MARVVLCYHLGKQDERPSTEAEKLDQEVPYYKGGYKSL